MKCTKKWREFFFIIIIITCSWFLSLQLALIVTMMNIEKFWLWMNMLQNQKKLYPKTPLSIFMVRLILCDCSLCQHGFDIQINQNILEKLIISRSAHQTPNFTNPEFQFPQFQVLQSGFSLYYMSSIGIFGCIFIST